MQTPARGASGLAWTRHRNKTMKIRVADFIRWSPEGCNGIAKDKITAILGKFGVRGQKTLAGTKERLRGVSLAAYTLTEHHAPHCSTNVAMICAGSTELVVRAHAHASLHGQVQAGMVDVDLGIE